MKKTFTVETTKSRVVTVNNKRAMKTEPLVLQVDIVLDGKLINLGYGYKSWWTEGREDHTSALPGQKYMIHNSIRPQEGDVWKYGNRVFVVGKKEGFLIYTAPLLENGKQVATIQFEDYYKD